MNEKMIRPVDVASDAIDVFRDLTIGVRRRPPGPPQRIDGMTVGIVTMEENAPHGGEVHPDGDEILYLISGCARVVFLDGDDDNVHRRRRTSLAMSP